MNYQSVLYKKHDYFVEQPVTFFFVTFFLGQIGVRLEEVNNQGVFFQKNEIFL